MPRFSVIVPAHRVQAYLRSCLASVLTQECRDIELIVVDDASPDACGEIIEETAAADPRVRALRLERPAGPGAARNAGAEAATGDYLLFLDGDDTLAPGALGALDTALARTGDPQLMLFDHALARPEGGPVPDGRLAALAEHDTGVFTLADHPGLLSLEPAVWNRVCRRDFLRRTGLRFPRGVHEYLPWSLPLLITAESVAALDRVCVHHRRRRTGGLLHTPGPHQLDLLAQYERLFAFLAAGPPEYRRWQPALHRRMTDQLITVCRTPGLLPADCREEFFRRAAVLCRRHRPPAGATALGGGRNGTARLLRLLLRLGAPR
ncbi:glycosyltransferase family 2 protein, partial [Streptomyces sp. YIM 98790]|uniref:glycosyltransferase family 2 protein n=1 Tax=Streptomyces sp. YIM 98790 TaxID=2689077 RepID=UPI00140E7810